MMFLCSQTQASTIRHLLEKNEMSEAKAAALTSQLEDAATNGTAQLQVVGKL